MAGDETSTLLGSLERQRATFAWKCSGLDAAGMQATVGASTMTLGGLVKHLALIEDVYFSRRLLGRDMGSLWPDADVDDPRLGVALGRQRLARAATGTLAGCREALPRCGHDRAGRR